MNDEYHQDFELLFHIFPKHLLENHFYNYVKAARIQPNGNIKQIGKREINGYQ